MKTRRAFGVGYPLNKSSRQEMEKEQKEGEEQKQEQKQEKKQYHPSPIGSTNNPTTKTGINTAYTCSHT